VGVLRAVGAGTGIALSSLGLVDHLRIEGIAIRPLDPAFRWDLEAVWRAPATPAVRRLVDFRVELSRGPETLIEPVRRPGDGQWPAEVRA
jgi:hypothetical protein